MKKQFKDLESAYSFIGSIIGDFFKTEKPNIDKILQERKREVKENGKNKII